MREQRDRGSIVIEASLTLPFFALLLLGVVALLQVAAADLALRNAAAETVKTTAANMYPIKLLYVEAKQRVEASKAAEVWTNVTGRVEQARDHVQTGEQFVEDFATYIPDPLVRLVNAEKTYRTAMEDAATNRLDDAVQAADKIANEAVTPVLVSFANTRVLKRDKLHVTSVEWPVLDDGERAWLGVEAQYEMKLSLPFVTKTIVLKKKAVERCWIGAS